MMGRIYRHDPIPPAPYSKDIAGVDPVATGFPHTRADEEWLLTYAGSVVGTTTRVNKGMREGRGR
jgi:hypothetical protein